MSEVMIIVLCQDQQLHIEANMPIQCKDRLIELSTTEHEPIGMDVKCRDLSVSFMTKFGDLVILHES